MAPPSPVLAQIAVDAWRETARLALSALSRRPGELGHAGRELARTIDLTAALPGGVAALAEYLAGLAPASVRAALVECLDWELHTYRGGRKVEASHRLEAFDPEGSEHSGAPAHGQPGFGEDALAMDLGAPHSMGDLTRYANAYLGSTFVNDAIDGDRAVELHNGTAADAMAAMRARGTATFHRLATPKLHFQILLGDDLRYAIACDDGRDMFRHLEKVLRAARSRSGRRVDPGRVSRFDHRLDEESYRPARFRRCFESSGPIPRQVTVGFKNALLGALAAQAKRKLDVVDGPDDFLDHSRLRYRDAHGERREVLMVRNPYGEAAIAMGALFRDCGVEEVLVYGTAASLDRSSQVGELHLASSVTSADGTAHDFRNHVLDAQFAELHAQPGTRLRSRVVNVRTPLDEFDCDIDRLRAEGHHLVEMELAGLLQGLRGGRARISVLHVVSDVPQSADTLESFSPTRAERALGAAVEVWVKTFGIAEL